MPGEHFEWRPPPKSYSAGQLASHIVDCTRWVEPIFASDELDFDTRPIKPSNFANTSELVSSYDKFVAGALRAMKECPDGSAEGPWRPTMRSKVWFEKSREDAFGDMTLHHLIHHRGQLSVYLRLLNVAVPGSYGPTADDKR